MKYVARALVVAMASYGSVAWAQEPSQRDRIHIAVQEICPVSGERLGEHGQPLKVKVGDEVVFFCCRGCLQQEIRPEYWAKIHANFANAQGICPVMKKPLPANPKWTIVEGQIFYVCCPSCTKKIAENPQGFLQQIDNLYAAALESRRKTR
jgi:YHS domain-containing protein